MLRQTTSTNVGETELVPEVYVTDGQAVDWKLIVVARHSHVVWGTCATCTSSQGRGVLQLWWCGLVLPSWSDG